MLRASRSKRAISIPPRCAARGEHLQRQLAAEPDVLGEIDLPHAARTERRDDAVVRQHVARRQGPVHRGHAWRCRASVQSTNTPRTDCGRKQVWSPPHPALSPQAGRGDRLCRRVRPLTWPLPQAGGGIACVAAFAPSPLASPASGRGDCLCRRPLPPHPGPLPAGGERGLLLWPRSPPHPGLSRRRGEGIACVAAFAPSPWPLPQWIPRAGGGIRLCRRVRPLTLASPASGRGYLLVSPRSSPHPGLSRKREGALMSRP